MSTPPVAPPSPPPPPGRPAASRPTRRRHPARGARAAALLASVAATGGVAAAMAASDGAFDATDDGRAAGTDQASSIPPVTAPSTTEANATPEASTTEPAAPTTAPPTSEDLAPGRYDDGVFTGTAEFTRWGDVQVEVTIDAGEVVDVAVLQIPDDDRRSSRISETAAPLLEAQAVAIQDADLDIVSGATYTSRTYAASLQAALDQAAVPQGTAT